MKKVKLVVINPYDNLCGYQYRPMQEAQFFKEKGYDIEVLVLERKVLGKGVKENEIEGVTVKHFLSKSPQMDVLIKKNSVIKRLRFLIYGKCYLEFIMWLHKECRHEKGSYIIAHNLEMAFAACLVNMFRKNKIVFVMRELYEGQSTNRIKRILISKISRWVQNRSEALVQVVPAQFDRTQKKNQQKIYYIPNYPNSPNYANIEHIGCDKIRINYIGSVRDEKSLKMLMDAAKDIEGIEVGIHGIGDAYEALKRIEKNYDNVKLTGYYDYKADTKCLFANSDIIYCAYNIEVPNWKIAYPIKLYEAMESGVPVLLCEGMAPVELVKENDCGFVFEYNTESLRQTLKGIREHTERLVEKQRNAQKLKGKYTWESVVTEYDKIIKR